VIQDPSVSVLDIGCLNEGRGACTKLEIEPNRLTADLRWLGPYALNIHRFDNFNPKGPYGQQRSVSIKRPT